MFKRVMAATAAFVFAAALAFAAPVTAKITSIEGKKVVLTLAGKADWVKKGGTVKWKAGTGRILEVKESTVTINTKNAADLKVGDEISVEKGPAALSGC
jgi:hypothetical protein